MAKLTKAQQLEIDALHLKLKLADERIVMLEREHADMIAELAPSSEQGAAYQSKLAAMEALLGDMGEIASKLVDQLRRARQGLEIVCSAAAAQDDARMAAVEAENTSQAHILATMQKARDLR